MQGRDKSEDSTKKVTWEEARQMLRYVAEEWGPREETEAEARAVLQRRARALARPAKGRDASSDIQRALLFMLGAEQYAVPVVHVHLIEQMAKLGRLTPVPCTPSFYAGVVNVRGKVISALDLRRLFDITISTDEPPPDTLVVVAANRLEIGLLSHEVAGVVDLLSDTLTSPTEALVGINPDYITGTTASGTILLDLEMLFSNERLTIYEEVI
jgi:purine-binding chemotaxis protein CheW